MVGPGAGAADQSHRLRLRRRPLILRRRAAERSAVSKDPLVPSALRTPMLCSERLSKGLS